MSLKFIKEILYHIPPLYRIATPIYRNLKREHYYRDDFWVINKYNIDCFLDVGANTGISGKQTRGLGYKGLIVSYEPVSSLYKKLKNRTNKDENWNSYQLAIGSKNGQEKINVLGGHGGASSILEPNYDHIPEDFIHYKKIGLENVNVITLDHAIENHTHNAHRIFIKVDVQGFEKKVMQGLNKHLDKIVACRLEMAINNNDYKNQDNMWQILEYMRKRGFTLTYLENQDYANDKYEMMYVDGIFLNSKYNQNS